MKRKIKCALLLVTFLGVAAIVVAGALVREAARGLTYSDVSAIPYSRVGVLLGCSKQLPDGRTNLFFVYRVAAASKLFRAHKIDYVIVSGDNHVVGYDEPTDMKCALVEAGIPAERIYCDFAGFRTLDSVVRAKEVFGQTRITIISQEFHSKRAIYIAGTVGIEAFGFDARDVDARNGLRTILREQLARVRTVLDVCLFKTRPKFLGPRIEIGADVQIPLKSNRSTQNNTG